LVIEDYIKSKNEGVFESWEELKILICFSKYLSVLRGEKDIKFENYEEAKGLLVEAIKRQKEHLAGLKKPEQGLKDKITNIV